jgi:hypothetical protein
MSLLFLCARPCARILAFVLVLVSRLRAFSHLRCKFFRSVLNGRIIDLNRQIFGLTSIGVVGGFALPMRVGERPLLRLRSSIQAKNCIDRGAVETAGSSRPFPFLTLTVTARTADFGFVSGGCPCAESGEVRIRPRPRKPDTRKK